MASTGEDDQRLSVTSSIRMQRAGDAKIDTMSVVADIVAMGTSADPRSICAELQSRWEKGRIYSNVGSVLLAVNPYRNIYTSKEGGNKESLYSDEVAREYYRNEITLAVEPHVFGVAANAYRNLITTRKPQCIVISGDSGAGKTETAKQVMHYLAVVDAEKQAAGDEAEVQRRMGLARNASRRSMFVVQSGAENDALPSPRPTSASLGGGSSSFGRMMSIGEGEDATNGEGSGAGNNVRAGSIRLSTAMASSVGSVVVQLLESNVILETFGNAETVRSFNSSRFGKYVEVSLSGGLVVGATINSYLLEKTRVVQQSASERNYHAFYQLLCGYEAEFNAPFVPNSSEDADTTTAAAYDFTKHLKHPPEFFNYLSNGLRSVPSVDDGKDLNDLLEALRLFMPDSKLRLVMRLLTAILHIGTLSIIDDVNNPGYGTIADASLEATSELLGVDPDSLRFALTNRQVQTGNRASIAVKQLDVDSCEIVRETLSKSLYAALFTSLIGTMNHVMASPRHTPLTLGTLDIYGFEILQNNSLEQFLINYVNEKLQALFIDRILRQAQEEYVLEGLDFQTFEYASNLPTCKLIEDKAGGLLSLLDDQLAYSDLGPGAAKNFVGTLESQCTKHESFLRRGRFDSDSTFKVKHYAGIVAYDATHFITKNKDEMNEELVTLMMQSDVPWFSEILDSPEPPEPPPDAANRESARRRGGAAAGGSTGGSKKRAPSMCAQFKKQVVTLMATLNATEPHFIRCLKPNEEKLPDSWDEERMTEQVIFNGIPENIKIAQGGFVWRVDWGAFIGRYKMTTPRTWPEPAEGVSEDDACRMICEDADIEEGLFVVGKKSKVFIKEHAIVEKLETLRDATLGKMCLSITKNFKARVVRKAYLRLKVAASIAWRLYKAKFAAKKYQRVRKSALQLQCLARGKSQRKRFAVIVAERTRAQREIESSIKIQSAARARKGKKVVAELRQKRLVLNSALLVQKAIRKWKSKKVLMALKQNKKEVDSSIKIQSAARARKGKKVVADLRQKRLELNSALLVQKAIRKWKSKKVLAALKLQKKELTSSIKIQSAARARKSKKYVGELRQNRLELNSALLMQRAIRKWKSKKMLAGLKQGKKELESTIKIQSAARARKGKKTVAGLRQKRLELKSALLVQKAIRKWKSKKVLAALKQDKKELASTIKIQSAARARKSKKYVGELRQNRLELNSALLMQRTIRKWKSKKMLAGLKQGKKELESTIKIQSAARARKGKKTVAGLRQKRLELKSALLVQKAIRKWKSKKVLAALKQDKKESLSAIKIQAIQRGKMGRGTGGQVRQAALEKKSSTKIQNLYRRENAKKEWRKYQKAVAVISMRLRMKLGRMKLARTRLEQELTFKMKSVLGVDIHRYLDGAVQPETQKVSVDIDTTKLSISWRPPFRGTKAEKAAAASLGGKRDDEHPMRLSQIKSVETSNAAQANVPALLTITNEDGRNWVLVFEDKATCMMFRRGLQKATGYIHTCYVTHEWDECLAAIEQQLQRSPSCEYPLYVKALIYRQRGRIQESLALFQTATCLNPRSANNLTQVGHSLALLGKHKQALTVYAEAAKTAEEQAEAATKGAGGRGAGSGSGSWPEDWALLHHSGASQLALGRYDEAVSWFTRALKAHPHEATYILLGKAHEQRGAFAQAQLVYQAAVRDNPESSELHTSLGLISLRLGGASSSPAQQGDAGAASGSTVALEHLSAACAANPKSVRALLGWASVTQDAKQPDAALLRYRAAIAQAPGCAQLWNNVGMCFFAKGQHDVASVCLRKALYLAPMEWTSAYNVGLVYLTTGQTASAFQHLHMCAQLNPTFAPAFTYLGVCLARLNDPRNAKHAYEKALALAPGDAIVHLNYALSLYNAGDDDDASKHLASFDKLVASKPKKGGASGGESAFDDPDVQRQARKLRAALNEATLHISLNSQGNKTHV